MLSMRTQNYLSGDCVTDLYLRAFHEYAIIAVVLASRAKKKLSKAWVEKQFGVLDMKNCSAILAKIGLLFESRYYYLSSTTKLPFYCQLKHIDRTVHTTVVQKQDVYCIAQ